MNFRDSPEMLENSMIYFYANCVGFSGNQSTTATANWNLVAPADVHCAYDSIGTDIQPLVMRTSALAANRKPKSVKNQ